jgi:hypothetical protein
MESSINLKLADKLLLLTWKKLLLIPGAWILCAVLHNAIYALFQPFFEPGGDEPFFFLLAVVVIPSYALACGVYSLFRFVVRFASRRRSGQ